MLLVEGMASLAPRLGQPSISALEQRPASVTFCSLALVPRLAACVGGWQVDASEMTRCRSSIKMFLQIVAVHVAL